MKKTQLELETKEQILQNINEAKLIVEKQTERFENLLIGKMVENYRGIDNQRLKSLFTKTFTSSTVVVLDELFKNITTSELEFYSKNLNTADLIFNTLNDERSQTIYLENLIKKINQKEESFQEIFKKSAIKENDEGEKEEYLSIDAAFKNFVEVIVRNPHLTMDESNELLEVTDHYYNNYKKDVLSAIKKLLSYNKTITVDNIDNAMDINKLRNGKPSIISKIERTIASNSLKVMEQLLENNINKNRKIATDELKVCSSSIVDLIFKMLPAEYYNQKSLLLDIIIDTSINERLGKYLDLETEKLKHILEAKNRDIIENELYEEKRYKKIDNYECDLEYVEKVYQAVLYEIIKAYDIPEEKRLNLIVLSETNSTKNVIKNMINRIISENQKSLTIIITEMHHLSEKAYSETGTHSSIQKNKIFK